MSFLTTQFIWVSVFLVVNLGSSLVRAESAEIHLEKTIGNTEDDKLIYLCSCNSIQEVVGSLPCDQFWDNHAQGKFKENLELLKNNSIPDNWDSVDKLARVEAQCRLFLDIAEPLFSCFTSNIKSNATLPLEKLIKNWLYNEVYRNTEILIEYGAIVEGDDDSKGQVETVFQQCLKDLINAKPKPTSN